MRRDGRTNEVSLHDRVVLAVFVDHVEAGGTDVREAREHLRAVLDARGRLPAAARGAEADTSASRMPPEL
jgi:hypothetical protein